MALNSELYLEAWVLVLDVVSSATGPAIHSFFPSSQCPPMEVIKHWSANPNNPVGENATLHLNDQGDLVLHNVDGSLAWSTNTSASSIQYMRLESNRHLRVYDWGPGWKVVADLLNDILSECNYPTICGSYGIA
ncbi:hypothetical protein MRB53_019974 [Persea americana]|uniref:Uncharacterized protein n=1 Tax=Persea americana TaxID=3435 RepID=A0ACC2KZL3_PERAE|nr:hypothetical protein MRB53_019974 [Persea americana]